MCDVGQFVKVGLLRWLVSPSPYGLGHHLGVIRYDDRGAGSVGGDAVVPLEQPRTSDSAEVDDDDLRSLDPDLYDRMRSAAPSVAERAAFRALPASTLRFDRPLRFDGLVRNDHANRVVTRQRWFHEAMVTVTPCSLVFLDSDVDVDSDRDSVATMAPTMAEIEQLLDRGQSVMTHRLVEASRWSSQSVEAHLGQLHDALGVGPMVMAHEGREHVRLFTVVPHRRHRSDLQDRVGALQLSRWGDELRLFRWHPALVKA